MSRKAFYNQDFFHIVVSCALCTSTWTRLESSLVTQTWTQTGKPRTQTQTQVMMTQLVPDLESTLLNWTWTLGTRDWLWLVNWWLDYNTADTSQKFPFTLSCNWQYSSILGASCPSMCLRGRQGSKNPRYTDLHWSSQKQHIKEDLWWRWEAKQIVEEAEWVGRSKQLK